ncbi:MAG TPA: hypothetical protein VIG33_05960 [Pseudobdellovibrionaceae bacterium]|jgi:hypothetical protein
MLDGSKLQLPQQFEWDFNVLSGDETTSLMKKVWPRYLIEESDLQEAPPSTELTDAELFRRFPMWGIRSKTDQKLVAFASAVLIPMDLTKKTLPDEGWQSAIQAYFSKFEANCLCLLSANVDPDFRKLRFSYFLLERAKELARSFGFNDVIAPVRPSQKDQFPSMPMIEYLEKQSDAGEIFDPWLRAHKNLGGEILNVCSQSVVIKATLSKWREWTGEALHQSGELLLPKGLVPLKVDVDANIGIYCEPNVWVHYRL